MSACDRLRQLMARLGVDEEPDADATPPPPPPAAAATSRADWLRARADAEAHPRPRKTGYVTTQMTALSSCSGGGVDELAALNRAAPAAIGLEAFMAVTDGIDGINDGHHLWARREGASEAHLRQAVAAYGALPPGHCRYKPMGWLMGVVKKLQRDGPAMR